ncbi:hypothetical protein [Cellulosilyticum sp. WCF-2]|uniref:hypothetical protein n=1 Tax=Cellulosilyticum sp. WCF-2 TaxID=2497860 RepID=UPI000F8EC81D|nr:hypothetical protein [Cellulosilyticum sp. WCF-2]QEH67287.1 hypothetical protein EKH84_02080 [Cellulosilyticum sp. WCF-2]QEH68200.1 hypothetical protein EKH84_07285 [Cellulosilyticum sp. WCF-2]
MNKKIRIVDEKTKKTIAIIENERFSRLPMISEYVAYGTSFYEIIGVLHGYEEDQLYVETLDNVLTN